MERELGACEVEHVACGSGLERIYAFLATDEPSNRPKIDLRVKLVRARTAVARGWHPQSAKALRFCAFVCLEQTLLSGP